MVYSKIIHSRWHLNKKFLDGRYVPERQKKQQILSQSVNWVIIPWGVWLGIEEWDRACFEGLDQIQEAWVLRSLCPYLAAWTRELPATSSWCMTLLTLDQGVKEGKDLIRASGLTGTNKGVSPIMLKQVVLLNTHVVANISDISRAWAMPRVSTIWGRTSLRKSSWSGKCFLSTAWRFQTKSLLLK